MIDLPLFTVFSATVCTSALLATGIVGGRVGAAVVAALIVAYASPFALYEFGAVFRRLESNSGVARRINTVLERGRPLPIVYYLATGPAGLDWRHQPLIFPDPAMIMPVGLPISRPKSWMAEYFPRARFTHPALGLDPQAHMAVIPEAVDIPDNGVARVDVFGTFSSFARSVSDRSEECRVFQFEELQDRRQLMHFFSYRTRVTVCLMRPAAA